MVVVKFHNTFYIGLDDEHVEGIRKGGTTSFNLKEFGLDVGIVLFTGKDEKSMYEALRESTNPMLDILKMKEAQNKKS